MRVRDDGVLGNCAFDRCRCTGSGWFRRDRDCVVVLYLEIVDSSAISRGSVSVSQGSVEMMPCLPSASIAHEHDSESEPQGAFPERRVFGRRSLVAFFDNSPVGGNQCPAHC